MKSLLILFSVEKTITGKTNTLIFKVDILRVLEIVQGIYTIEKTSDDSDFPGTTENIQATGWFEIENSVQAYPRTAHIGYALKAVDEHQNGVPNFTSSKRVISKSSSNYNQPILENGEIDWRQVEIAPGTYGNGYFLQSSGTSSVQTNSTLKFI